MAFTFKGTYTKNRGDQAAAGTVEVKTRAGTQVGIATLAADGSYTLVIDAQEGEMKVIETITGVPVRSYEASVSRGSVTDTSRDVGYLVGTLGDAATDTEVGAAIDAHEIDPLAHGAYVPVGERLRPTAVKAASMSRLGTMGNTAALVSGRQNFQLIYIEAGLVTDISFYGWTTAGVSLTNQWFSLYDINRNKLAVTVDDTTAAWAAFATKTLALSSPYTVTASGLYYVGIMVAAATVPSLVGGIVPAAYSQMAPMLMGHDATNVGLTTPATAPATAAALSGNGSIPGPLLVVLK